MLTIRDLVTRNKEALEQGILQAQLRPGSENCVYRDLGSGARCAIGALFSDEFIEQLVDKHMNYSTTVSDLVGHKVIEVEDLVVFQTTQDLHDSWTTTAGFFAPDALDQLKPQAKQFVLDRDGGSIRQADFQAWLDIVEKEYLGA